ncbi:MAG TPA: hypothetical protein VFC77_10395 [Myxococcota bacterium]|nr:hypothetical protein [Myxococcota bacterium]
MSPTLAISLLSGLTSLLAGLVVGRGLLKRRQGEQCRQLAQDLTDKVHDRCDAYRRLEERITGVIGDFEAQDAAPLEAIGQAPLRQAAPAATAAACSDGLSWMDACAGTCPPAAAQVEQTRTTDFLGLSQEFTGAETTTESSTRSVESEIDVFAERLRGAQDSNRALLEEQARAIEDLRRRLASMESAPRPTAEPRPASARVPAASAPRRTASPDPELGGLADSLARSELELQAWREQCETVIQEREAVIAKAREVLAQLHFAAPAAAECENCVRANDLARQIVEIRPDLDAVRVKPQAEPRSVQPAVASEAPRPIVPSPASPVISGSPGRSREVEELEQRLASKEKEVAAMRGELSRAGQVIDGNHTRITSLMRSLQETEAKAEERRRLVQEQSTQVSEAYSMLDRMRPLLKAIEGAAADEQHSALTPEYLEARSRG